VADKAAYEVNRPLAHNYSFRLPVCCRKIIDGQFDVDRGSIYPTEAVLVPVVRREVFRERLAHDVAGTTMLLNGHRVELFIDGLRQPDLANL